MRNVISNYCAIRRWSSFHRLFVFCIFACILVLFYDQSLLYVEYRTGRYERGNVINGGKILQRTFILNDDAVESHERIKREFNGAAISELRSIADKQLVPSYVEETKNKVSRTVIKAVHLGVAVCGERIEESLMMLKSAVIFGQKPLHVHVFTDDGLWSKFAESLEQWQKLIKRRSFSYTLHLASFPSKQADEWRRLFKLCASQRLFLPDLLTNTDALLYVDTDVLFLRPPEDLWSYFNLFNNSQIAALAPESEELSTNWYARFARHPFYKPLGINSGVILMNLTRMRDFHWTDQLTPVLVKYRYNITWGDQDIINIVFSQFPEKLYVLGCDWNYRPDHCIYTSTCQNAEQFGASVLHGSRGYFRTGKQPTFKAVYDAIKGYKFGTDLKENLYDKLKMALYSTANTTCGTFPHIFLKQVETYINYSIAQVMP